MQRPSAKASAVDAARCRKYPLYADAAPHATVAGLLKTWALRAIIDRHRLARGAEQPTASVLPARCPKPERLEDSHRPHGIILAAVGSMADSPDYTYPTPVIQL